MSVKPEYVVGACAAAAAGAAIGFMFGKFGIFFLIFLGVGEEENPIINPVNV